MAKPAFIVTPNAVSVFFRGSQHIVDKSRPQFGEVIELLQSRDPDEDRLATLLDLKRAVADYMRGDVEIIGDTVYYKGEEVGSVIAMKIIQLFKGGYDPDPMMLFLNNLMQNPITSAREELYQWLEAGNAPITPDGCFLAYKRINENYTDSYTGKMDNSVGKIVSVPREQVDTNRLCTCSFGLHFCQLGYLDHYGHVDSRYRVVVVKVNPANVMSIPVDYNFQKGRTFEYEVVGEVDNDHTKLTTHFDKPVDDRYEPKVASNSDVKDDDVFISRGKTFPAKQIKDAVKAHGSVSAAGRALSVPKSTFAGWVKKIGILIGVVKSDETKAVVTDTSRDKKPDFSKAKTISAADGLTQGLKNPAQTKSVEEPEHRGFALSVLKKTLEEEGSLRKLAARVKLPRGSLTKFLRENGVDV